MKSRTLIRAHGRAHTASNNLLLAAYAESPVWAKELESLAIKELAGAASLLGFTLQPITEKEAAA